MDIKTAMALRNYGINPQSKLSMPAESVTGGDSFLKQMDKFDSAPAGKIKQDFSSIMKNIAAESIDTLKTSEKTATDGMTGKADVQSVVEAMTQAEMTVKTITAVRDKVVEAYQEILRMPV